MIRRPSAPPSAAAQVQQRLWGTDAQGWARFAEPHNRPLFAAVLDAAGVVTGSRVLDVGCGTGMVLQLALERGAAGVAGVDITSELLEVAQERLPSVELWCADMEELPLASGSFDAVVGVNSFQFAGDPRRALAEAARVCAPGGAVVASLFAEPERSQSTAVHLALSQVSPPERGSDHAPYALSAPGNLEAALEAAGLEGATAGEVVLDWRYDSVADGVRGLLSSAGAARAVEDAGRHAVQDVVETAFAPFTDPATGAVRMRNTFRWVCARKPVTSG